MDDYIFYGISQKFGEGTDLSLIAVGSTGPTGPTGFQENQGGQGNTGPTGMQGIQGNTGPTGMQGIQGIQGIAGTNGTNGAVGDTGPQGIAGTNGTNGAVGDTGNTGPTGAQGIAGTNGTNGAVGAQGIQGDTGNTGPTGTFNSSDIVCQSLSTSGTITGGTGHFNYIKVTNLNVSNTLNSSGLTVNTGTVDFSSAAFVNNCIPSAAVSSTNASTIAVANDATLSITSGYIPYCGVTNTNVELKTNGSLRYNAVTGTLTTTINGNASSANTSTTQATSDSSTNIATTAFVQSNLSNYLTTLTAASTYAPKASPILTGTPTAPTPTTTDSSTNIATTAFVQTNLSSYLTTSTAASTYVSKTNGFTNAPTSYSSPAPASTQIGYYMSVSPANTFIVSTDNYKQVANLTVTPGIWLFQGGAYISGNLSLLYYISINPVNTTTTLNTECYSCYNTGSGGAVRASQIYYYTATGTSTTMYLQVRYSGTTSTNLNQITFSATRIA
jgi:hypothetical protein